MNLILEYVQKIPFIPEHWNVPAAQVISALVFILILYGVARFFSWFFNRYVSGLLLRFKVERWAKAMQTHRFFTAAGVVAAAIVAATASIEAEI